MSKHRNSRNALFGALVTGLLFAATASAQPPGGGQRQGREGGPPAIPDSAGIVEMVGELASELSLTTEQETILTVLHFEHFGDAEALRVQYQGDREGHREAMQTLREDFQERVATVLSDEQKARYEELMEERASRRGPRGRGRR
ncbi:MAG: hypothetical protein HKN20_17735 [Gemmatimonadetes bacterium]|nr:hypothetical protein [Gemmatimonadota bacterium]